MRYAVTGGIADRKSTRLNSSHLVISYAVFCLKKKDGGGWAFIGGSCVRWVSSECGVRAPRVATRSRPQREHAHVPHHASNFIYFFFFFKSGPPHRLPLFPPPPPPPD